MRVVSASVLLSFQVIPAWQRFDFVAGIDPAARSLLAARVRWFVRETTLQMSGSRRIWAPAAAMSAPSHPLRAL